ncbi:hypothetical protein BGZ76_010175 [Entomortierella beljakovae]|nr:hypothetical protein BGZ76_010175 [Entomortierella beljakovae]
MAKHGLLSPAGSKVIAGLILNYTLPALLFAKMVTCVNRDNIEELAFVALAAALFLIFGGLMGIAIQRTNMVPKRLRFGIIAATMFTNFGDLPISIILAVSDHPPFLVGDGARGTAYSSVFISVFYLFLFPLGGYRLIRYDHVKETKRLQELAASIREHEENVQTVQMSNASDCTLSDNNIPESIQITDEQQLQQQVQQNQHLTSPRHYRNQTKSNDQGLPTSFSATSTMISMGGTSDDNSKELKYRPLENEQPGSVNDIAGFQQRRFDYSTVSESSLPLRAVNPFIHTPSSSGGSFNGSDRTMPIINSQQHGVAYPLHTFKSDNLRHSVDSMISNGTGATRFSAHDDDHGLIQPISKGTYSMRSKSFRSHINKGYQPPPLNCSQSGSSFSLSPTRPTTSTQQFVVSPSREGTLSPNGVVGAENMASVPLGPADVAVDLLPRVPPALQKSHDSVHVKQAHWFWRAFHSIREYLTPPTIGLILGLLVAVTPLRELFLVTPNPLPSLDDLPPLSFILEVTLMLGACCVPMGLTVLGASLSRLKPGRMRPLIPVMTMITVVKLIITPVIGIVFVQMVMVHRLGWISAQNHMLQFTLMLMSGSPTSITCFVLAQVWDRRTNNAGSEMAALIAVQYAVSVFSLTFGCAVMIYFLF